MDRLFGVLHKTAVGGCILTTGYLGVETFRAMYSITSYRIREEAKSPSLSPPANAEGVPATAPANTSAAMASDKEKAS